jgi:cation diffusion facilitator family transporter
MCPINNDCSRSARNVPGSCRQHVAGRYQDFDGGCGHSQALIADGIESMADILSSLVVWRGLVVADSPTDQGHPYGHGKAEPIAAGIVAIMLLLAALWIAIQSVEQILVPHQTPAPYTLAVLFIVIVIKELLFRKTLETGHELESSALRSDAWHHRSDAITSFAAAIGIIGALIGGPGYEWADDAAALLAAFIIGWNSIRIGRPAMSELMDAAAPEELHQQIVDAAPICSRRCLHPKVHCSCAWVLVFRRLARSRGSADDGGPVACCCARCKEFIAFAISEDTRRVGAHRAGLSARHGVGKNFAAR